MKFSDGLFGVIAFKAQQRCNRALVIEQQTIFGTACQHVQGVTHFPEKLLRRGEQGVFTFDQETFTGERAQVQRAVLATGDPQNRLNITESTG
jgi:hypothetical protein